MKRTFLYVACAICMSSCAKDISSTQVWLTSAAGDKFAEQESVIFHKGEVDNAVTIDINEKKQTIDGYGGSLTESSAFVLACLTDEQRQSVLHELFSEEGANFSVVRTQIGSSDFSVEGKYALTEVDGDTAMQFFSLDRDKEGFSVAQYPQVKDEQYDLYHLMKDVWNIKQTQSDKTYRIMASPWTAPAWMKDNKKYYERENGVARGGALLPQYYQAYANYITEYVKAWQQEGVNIWSVTPVNEPMGNDGGWESMDFSPQVETEFIKNYLAPTLARNGLQDVAIYGFDQNIFEMQPYADAIYQDSLACQYTTGMAVHWYGSTIGCFPETLEEVHAQYPNKSIFHSEGCIDNLGCPPWDGVTEPVGFQESGWFNNDAFWWNKIATDWAYSTRWAGGTHPKYSPVFRYAQYIIDGTNHWLTGYCDWNIVLDSIGGPNHVNNFAGAQVMIDNANNVVYYTPYYYVLKQFSRSMRPGDVALQVHYPSTMKTGVDCETQDIFLCAVEKTDDSYAINILNMGPATTLPIQLGDYYAQIELPASSVKTIIVTL
ncbi:MAG: hypothetical protein IKW35_07215 [Paludibacteraceae bacterium]|nr:hypothetical protein [Paludibacteraceae bacterium]